MSKSPVHLGKRILAMAAMVFALFPAFTLTASAEEPVTVTLAEWRSPSVAVGATELSATGGVIGANATLSIVGTTSNVLDWANSAIHRTGGFNGKADVAYWLFETSSKGYSDITVSYAIRSSATGPRDFRLQFSTDGETWQNANEPADIVVRNALAITHANSQFSATLPSDADDADMLLIRLLQTSNTATNDLTVGSSGTNSINNIVITGVVMEQLCICEYIEEYVDPTCTEEGYTIYTCDCGDWYICDYVAPLGHDYHAEVIPATCTEWGYTVYACIDCAYWYTCDDVAPLGHDYHAEVIPATCTEWGYTVYACIDCAYWYTCDDVAPLGHDYHGEVIPATCTEWGYTVYACVDCAYWYTCDYVEPFGHEYDIDTVYRDINGNWWILCMYCDDEPLYEPSDAEFLFVRTDEILWRGLSTQQLHLSANNNAVLTLWLDGRAFVLAERVNNRNVAGRITLPDGSGELIFDIRGNGSNVREFRVLVP